MSPEKSTASWFRPSPRVFADRVIDECRIVAMTGIA
jgi:hypothetical protein